MFRPNHTALSVISAERPICPHWCPAMNVVTGLQEAMMGRDAERNASTLNKSVVGAKERRVTNHMERCRSVIGDETYELPLTGLQGQ